MLEFGTLYLKTRGAYRDANNILCSIASAVNGSNFGTPPDVPVLQQQSLP